MKKLSKGQKVEIEALSRITDRLIWNYIAQGRDVSSLLRTRGILESTKNGTFLTGSVDLPEDWKDWVKDIYIEVKQEDPNIRLQKDYDLHINPDGTVDKPWTREDIDNYF